MYKTFPHAGGVRVPMLLSWPAGLPRTADDDGVRHQFAHAVDIGPTLLQLAGVEPLAERHGLPARETDGVPFGNWLRNPAAASDHTTQYTELNGRRGYIAGTWKAIAPEPNGPGWKQDGWELYDLAADPTELVNVAAEHPEKVRELAAKWQADAWWNQVYPLNDDGSFNRNRPASELLLEQPVTLYPGAPTLERYRSAKLVRLRSFTIDAQVEIADGDGGVLVAHGDQGGGYVLFLEDGELVLTYNEYGEVKRIGAPVQPGLHDIRVEFAALPDFKWAISLHVDGRQVAVLPEVFQLTGMAPVRRNQRGAGPRRPGGLGALPAPRLLPLHRAAAPGPLHPGPQGGLQPGADRGTGPRHGRRLRITTAVRRSARARHLPAAAAAELLRRRRCGSRCCRPPSPGCSRNGPRRGSGCSTSRGRGTTRRASPGPARCVGPAGRPAGTCGSTSGRNQSAHHSHTLPLVS